MQARLSIREFTPADISAMVDYFHGSSPGFLRGMGVDPAKLPDRDSWCEMLLADCQLPLPQRRFYYLAWLRDGEAVGHSNVNKIEFGDHAFMHLHLWRSDLRQQGHGRQWLGLCVRQYFEGLQLQRLYSEPNAHNPGPNHTLPGLGFEFERCHETIPGWINFHQPVNRWRLDRERWLVLQSAGRCDPVAKAD